MPILDNGHQLVQAENLPVPVIDQSIIKNIAIKNSEDVHFGPRFIGESINYTRIDKTKKFPLKYIIILIVLVVLLVVMVIVFMLTVKGSGGNNGEPTTPSTTTHPITTITLTPSPIPTKPTTTKPPPTPPPTPPADWLVPYSTWGVLPLPKCTPLQGVWTLAIGTPLQNCSSSADLEGLNEILYNFYLTPSGLVYEGLGWKCSPDYQERYDRLGLSVAFCGQVLTLEQKIVFDRLIRAGQEEVLKEYFNVIPDCCRGLQERKGPAKDVSSYLVEKFASHGTMKFKNYACLKAMNCI